MNKKRWYKVKNIIMVLVFIVGTGIYNRALSAEGKSSSLKFDGKDDYVKVEDSAGLNPTDAITIEAWVKPVGTHRESSPYGIVAKGHPWWSNKGYELDIYSDNYLRWAIGDGSNWVEFNPSFSGMGSFSHIVATFDSSDKYLRVYINGEQTPPKLTALTGIGIDEVFLRIGTLHDESYYFNGLIDEVRIYNRALSAAEVAEHFKDIYKDETGLVLHIPFSDGSGNIATGYSGKGNHGTLQGYNEGEKVAGYGDSHDTGWTTIERGKETSLNISFSILAEKSFYEDEEMKTALNITTLKPDKYKIIFKVRDEKDNIVLTKEEDGELQRGSNSISFSFSTQEIAPGDCKIESIIYEGDEIVETKEISFLKLDRNYIDLKLLDARERRIELESLLDEAKDKGIDITYPKVSWALSSLFERYIREELEVAVSSSIEYFKLNYQVNYILNCTNKAIEQIKEWIKDSSKQITVPHISINNLEIRDGEFYQGKEPVLLLGSLGNFGRGYPLSDFALYSSLGFNATEILLGYSTLYTTPKDEGELSKSWFKELDEYMKEAEKNNITTYHTIHISCSFAPWVSKKYSSIFTCGSNYMPHCLINPETRQLYGNFLRKTIPLIKDYPNLLGYCLINEPHYKWTGYCSHCQSAFREYLKREYKDISKLNKSWKTNYKDFKEVGIPPQGRASRFFADNAPTSAPTILKPENPAPINEASMYDWQRFNQYRMTEFFSFMKEVIRENDKKTPIFWESPFVCATWGEFGEDGGIDFEEIAKRSEINGCDGWISGFPGDKYVMGVDVSRYDLIKSLAPDKPLFNTEWHGVTHIVGVEYSEAVKKRPYDFVRTSIWIAYLHGYSAGILWAWGGENNKHWQLLALPQCLEAAGRTSLELRRFTKEVVMFHKAPREVVILFSMPSKLQHKAYLEEIKKFQSLGYVPEEAKKRAISTHSVSMEELNKIHFSSQFLDTNYGFISEEQIKEGLLNRYKLLIVPRADYISDETYEKTKDYVRKGGKVLLISDSLNYDERGNKRDISELFKSSKDLSLAGLSLKLYRLGKGEIYQMNPLSVEKYSKLFDSLLDETGIERTFRLTDTQGNSIDGIEFRVVKSEEGYLAYLINLNKKEVKVKLKGKGREINKADELINNKSISFPLEIKPMDPLLIRIKK